MTHDAATEVIQAQNHDAQHRRQRSQQIIWSVLPIAVIFSVVAFVVAMLAMTRQVQAETERADRTKVALNEACAQVNRMGAICVVDPNDFKGPAGEQGRQGDRGDQGLPGRPPTKAEIAAAVADYLLAHPPARGPAGPPGENGGPGSTCPDGLSLRSVTVRDAVTKKLVRILVCMP